MTGKFRIHIAHISFALLMVILLCSCEGETTYTQRVTNFSNDTIALQIVSQYDNTLDYVFLTPGKSETLFVLSKLGGDESAPNCTFEIDSVIVFIASGKTLKKDFTNPNDWTHTYYSRNNGRFVDQYCDFEIFPIDLGY